MGHYILTKCLLPLIQGLCADLAAVIDTHQRGSMGFFRLVQRRIRHLRIRVGPHAMCLTKQGTQALIELDDQTIQIKHDASLKTIVIPAQAGIQQNTLPRSGQKPNSVPLRGENNTTGFPPARE